MGWFGGNSSRKMQLDEVADIVQGLLVRVSLGVAALELGRALKPSSRFLDDNGEAQLCHGVGQGTHTLEALTARAYSHGQGKPGGINPLVKAP